jgi:hypothetical protein
MSAPLFGLIGYAQAGKDTFAASLTGYHRIAFADPLKHLARATKPMFINDQEPSPFHARQDLDMFVSLYGWEFCKANIRGVRVYLQNLGVAVRDVLGQDVWVQAAFKDYDPAVPTVFTDVRFPNELDAIKSRGGQIIRIVREGSKPPNDHISERFCDTVEPDFTVSAADGAVASLRLKAEMFAESWWTAAELA